MSDNTLDEAKVARVRALAEELLDHSVTLTDDADDAEKMFFLATAVTCKMLGRSREETLHIMGINYDGVELAKGWA